MHELLELWEEQAFLDPADPGLSQDERMAAGECARLVADLDGLQRLAAGWTRREVLARARAFLGAELRDYPRDVRGLLEADYIEEIADSGDLDAALGLAADSRRAFADVPHVLAEIVLLEANHLQNLGRYGEALDSTLEAQRLLEGLAPDQAPRSYVPIMAKAVEGLILIAMGLPDRAVDLLEECEAALELPENHSSEGLVMTLATQLAFARDDFEWVEQYLPPRLESGGFGGDTPSIVQARRLDVATARARSALVRRADRQGAFTALRQTLAIDDLSVLTAIDGTLALAELAMDLGTPEEGLKLLARLESDLDEQLSPRANLPRHAVWELKGRIHLRMGSNPTELIPIQDGLEKSLREMLEAWDTSPERDGGVGFLLFDSRSSLVATLIRVTLARDRGPQGVERALEHVLDAEARSSLAELLGTERPAVGRIVGQLSRPRHGLLVYIPSPHGSILFVIASSGIQSLEVGGVGDLRKLNAQWCAGWVGGDGDAAMTAKIEEELLDLLLPTELEDEFSSWDSLTIVGADSLNFVPFEALRLRRPGSNYLGLTHSISYLPSLTVGLHLVRGEMLHGPSEPEALVQFAVGLGKVNGSDGAALPALPWRESDFARLREPWRASKVELETDPSRARAAVLSAGARGVHLLEILAHGDRKLELERGQGFAFDEANGVYPDDLRGVATPPVVALAVCDAGRGALRSGDEGISHLGGAFLASGSRTVLLSQHDLWYEATVALLAAFHRHLSNGEPLTEALLHARREVAATPGWNHPRFHALLHVYGDGTNPGPTPLVRRAHASSAWPTPLALVALALVGLAALGVRARGRREGRAA